MFRGEVFTFSTLFARGEHVRPQRKHFIRFASSVRRYQCKRCVIMKCVRVSHHEPIPKVRQLRSCETRECNVDVRFDDDVDAAAAIRHHALHQLWRWQAIGFGIIASQYLFTQLIRIFHVTRARGEKVLRASTDEVVERYEHILEILQRPVIHHTHHQRPKFPHAWGHDRSEIRQVGQYLQDFLKHVVAFFANHFVQNREHGGFEFGVHVR